MSKTRKFYADGMTCGSCEKIIKKQAMKVDGVEHIEIDYATQTGSITFDETKTDIDTILYKIEEHPYTCSLVGGGSGTLSGITNHFKKTWAWIFGVMGLTLIAYFLYTFTGGIGMSEISSDMSLALLFVVGLLTGFHCIGMCGGFVVAYTTKASQNGQKHHKSHLLYGIGKTLSYTIIGAMFGLLGSIIAFTPMIRGVAGIVAGIFLIIFSLNMLNTFPWLRKIRIKTPKFVGRFVSKETKKHSNPLIIGLLNGLMIACGPLQAIYIMAAGTGSMIAGAKLLFVFGLGTLPVLLGFGYVAGFFSSKATQKLLKVSGVIVLVLGVIMINRGFALTGTGYDANTIFASVSASGITGAAVQDSPIVMKNGFQEIHMTVDRYGWSPNKFVLKEGVPVRWIIQGEEINGCNNAIQVPKYNLNFPIKPGTQTIEFTPTESGTISWSCWMGMIPGTFIVKDDINLEDDVAIQKELDDIDVPAGRSCSGGSGGSGGCGCGRGA